MKKASRLVTVLTIVVASAWLLASLTMIRFGMTEELILRHGLRDLKADLASNRDTGSLVAKIDAAMADADRSREAARRSAGYSFGLSLVGMITALGGLLYARRELKNGDQAAETSRR